MCAEQPTTTLERFFAGLAEQTFEVKLGVVDPQLIDYLSKLLIRFLRNDPQHRIRKHSPRELDQMVVEAEAQIGCARRIVHRHIGDLALFWAGLFPEHLRRSRGNENIDRFGEYCLRGKRAYLIASSIQTNAEGSVPCDLLQRLGREFEICVRGLHELRSEWVQQDGTASNLFLI